MNTLLNRILIFLLCTTFWLTKPISFGTVCLFLLVLLCGNLICLVNSSKLFLLFSIGLILCSFATPDLCYFYPYLLYEMQGKHHYNKLILTLLPLCEIILLYPSPLAIWLFSGLFFLLSFQLQRNTEQNLYWEKRYQQTRNENYERSYDLLEKNKALCQNQDYEIHLATLKERNRIAREIHDNVGHLLSRSLLQTGALQVINKDPVLDTQLKTLKESLDTAMTSIRNSVHDLHDESIHLQTALTDLQKDCSDLCVSLYYTMQTEPPKECKYAILAITKEALTNTRRHSNATEFEIHLTEHPAFYQLILKDNGTMISKQLSGGIGLENMRERVNQLGGEFHIITSDGFRIQIILWKGENA